MMKTLFVSLFMVAVFACSDDGPNDLVGGSCVDDRDCQERCLQGGDYPGGFCSVTCRDDVDCPEDTICVDKDNGVCVFPCDAVADCDFLGGADYTCRATDDWAGREVLVCLGR